MIVRLFDYYGYIDSAFGKMRHREGLYFFFGEYSEAIISLEKDHKSIIGMLNRDILRVIEDAEKI